MRWVYIKNGDVVSQLKQLEDDADVMAGPNAFLADFIRGINNSPVLMMSWCPIKGRYKSETIDATSYQVIGSRLGKIGNTFFRLYATLSGMIKVLRFRPDKIICGRIGPMLWVTVVVSKVLSCPFIHSRHNSLYEQQSKWHQKVFAKIDVACIRFANAVICHGPFLCAQMEEIGVDKNKVIEFDVAFSNFNGDVKENTETRDILFIGRMAANKGIFDLLDAAENLIRSDVNIRLNYIGDGPDTKRLEKEIENRGLSSQVVCFGKIPHAELPIHINASFLVATPTRREFPEGRCLAAMEALACAVPLIAPDSGPFPYLVNNEKNGVLFEADNVDSLSSALEKCFGDADYYQRLKRGAEQTSKQLQTPVRTFYQAVEIAFDV